MIHVVIPVLNRWHFTEPCLAALQRQTYRGFKVVIVDHGSTDGTRDYIPALFPEAVLLHGNLSMWWAAATNMGVRYALAENSEAIITLNNDTIPPANYIEELSKASRLAGPSALIGSTAVDAATGKQIPTGENVIWWLDSVTCPNLNNSVYARNSLVPCQRYPGRGLFVPATVYRSIGLYDEHVFPHYLADYDFTHRATKRGFRIFTSRDAVLVTYPEETAGNQLLRNKTIQNYYSHLFTIRGKAQLSTFFRFALRHCPFHALPSFLFAGTLRRLAGYWLR